jgi:hypothetical protein
VAEAIVGVPEVLGEALEIESAAERLAFPAIQFRESDGSNGPALHGPAATRAVAITT